MDKRVDMRHKKAFRCFRLPNLGHAMLNRIKKKRFLSPQNELLADDCFHKNSISRCCCIREFHSNCSIHFLFRHFSLSYAVRLYDVVSVCPHQMIKRNDRDLMCLSNFFRLHPIRNQFAAVKSQLKVKQNKKRTENLMIIDQSIRLKLRFASMNK